jgi:hypothetical protein
VASRTDNSFGIKCLTDQTSDDFAVEDSLPMELIIDQGMALRPSGPISNRPLILFDRQVPGKSLWYPTL